MKKMFAGCMLMLALLTTAGIAAVPTVAAKAVSLLPATSPTFPNLDDQMKFAQVAQFNSCPNPHQKCTTTCHQECNGYNCRDICTTRCRNVCGLY